MTDVLQKADLKNIVKNILVFRPAHLLESGANKCNGSLDKE